MSAEPNPPSKKRHGGRWAAVIVVICASAGTQQWFRHRLPERFATVVPGVLYRSAQPTTGEIDNLAREYHIRTILVVRDGESRHVPDEKAHAERAGIKVVHIPIKGRGEITDDEVRTFFQYVDDPEYHPVLVHCSAGRHRTGYLTALYRMERQGWTEERAEREMLSFGFETNVQTEVLEQLRRRTSRQSDRSPTATNVAGGSALRR